MPLAPIVLAALATADSCGVALRAGLPVWELKAKQADLEELFFSLTEGTNRNLGDGPAAEAVPTDAPAPPAAAPTERDAVSGEEGANL